MSAVSPSAYAATRIAVCSTNPEPHFFSTPNTNLCAYLIAANRLLYCGARLAAGGANVDLLFHDPHCDGPNLLRRFNAGAVEQVNARVLFETRGYLLSEVKRTLAVSDGAR
jgi:hypothetical protein